MFTTLIACPLLATMPVFASSDMRGNGTPDDIDSLEGHDHYTEVRVPTVGVLYRELIEKNGLSDPDVMQLMIKNGIWDPEAALESSYRKNAHRSGPAEVERMLKELGASDDDIINAIAGQARVDHPYQELLVDLARFTQAVMFTMTELASNLKEISDSLRDKPSEATAFEICLRALTAIRNTLIEKPILRIVLESNAEIAYEKEPELAKTIRRCKGYFRHMFRAALPSQIAAKLSHEEEAAILQDIWRMLLGSVNEAFRGYEHPSLMERLFELSQRDGDREVRRILMMELSAVKYLKSTDDT